MTVSVEPSSSDESSIRAISSSVVDKDDILELTQETIILDFLNRA